MNPVIQLFLRTYGIRIICISKRRFDNQQGGAFQLSFTVNDLQLFEVLLHTVRPVNDATEGSTQEAHMCAS